MLVNREEALQVFEDLLGKENVLTDEKSRKDCDLLNRAYAKAHGIYETPLPIAILNVNSTEEISKVLKYCNDNLIAAIPRTGASGGESLLEPIKEETVFVDASSMNELIKLDEENMMVTAGCGMPLEKLEEILNEKGLTTGHTPQSLPMAHLGGLVATRSTGQFSTYYGGIEDMVCGLEAVLASGEVVRIRNVPRRSAGPDLRHMFIGSEGALGFITEVTMKLFPYAPENRWAGGYIVKNMDIGFKTIRDIMAAGYKPSVVRLYDKPDFDRNFGSVELDENEGFMFFVVEGPANIAQITGEQIDKISLGHGGKYIGTDAIDHWMIHRNDICKEYGTKERDEKLRKTKTYYATTEISASWTDIVKIYHDAMEMIPARFADKLVSFGGHVSHSYMNGTNIYFIYDLKMDSPETSNVEHTEMVHAISDIVLKYGTGGCVHHHGMGKRRLAMAKKEHGTSYQLMIGLKRMLDPNNIMNPGTLVTVEDFEG